MEFFKKFFSSKNKSFDKEQENEQEETLNMPNDELFVYHYKQNGGKFFYPADMDDFKNELINLLKYLKKDKYTVIERSYLHFLEKMNIPVSTELNENDVLLGGCEHLIADQGAIMTTSKQTQNLRNSELPHIRVFIALSNQIVTSKADALHNINKKYEVHPSNIQTASRFKEPKKNSVDNKWYDTYLFLIEN
jgi:hypothetical protein